MMHGPINIRLSRILSKPNIGLILSVVVCMYVCMYVCVCVCVRARAEYWVEAYQNNI